MPQRAFSPAFFVVALLMATALSLALTSWGDTSERVTSFDEVDTVEVPEVTGGTGGPVVLDVPSGTDGSGTVSGIETVPPPAQGTNLSVFQRYAIIIVIAAVIASMAIYMPRAVQMTRIDIAQRESMAARLALARGDYAGALAGFDRAIDEAQMAYTRKRRVDRPAEWTMLPDAFYISLWRGRAAALRGLGRVRSALATNWLADELEAVVGNGLGHE